MNSDKIQLLVNNDKEWRTYILNKLDKLESNQREQSLAINSLKIKVGFFSALFGIMGSVSFNLIQRFLRG